MDGDGLDAVVRVSDRAGLDVSLRVGPGEVVTVAGPNGAGKTTLCLALAGLIPLTEGRVVLGTRCLEDTGAGIRLAPHRRGIGVVFQDLRLLGRRQAVDNVGLALRLNGWSRRDARREAEQWLARLGLDGRDRVPARDLSGGEAQRVALARALAWDPLMVVADEPTSGLDAEARSVGRRLLGEHLRTRTGPSLVVTHDPLEALSLGHRVAVIERGRISQIGHPQELRTRPRTAYVATLLGLNLVRGRWSSGTVRVADTGLTAGAATEGPPPGENSEVMAVFHPRSVTLSLSPPRTSARNLWPATVVALEQAQDLVRIELGGSIAAVAEVTSAAVSELGIVPGLAVWASVKASEVSVQPLVDP